MSYQPCSHLRVHIRAILKAFDKRAGFRLIGGRCQDCARNVRREMTEREIKTGIAQTSWRTA